MPAPHRPYPATSANTKRANWLISHDGYCALSANQINDAMEMSLVKECHSLVQDGTVYTLVHLCDQKRVATLNDISVVMGLAEYKARSFTNAKAAFKEEAVYKIVRFFAEKDEALHSTWKRNCAPKPGFFFHALLTKYNEPIREKKTWPDQRKYMTIRMEELQRERDEYKRKFEELAATIADRMLDAQ